MTLDAILQRLSVVKETQRNGRKQYICWCPFHADGKGDPPHSPDFRVDADGYRCHACNEHGSLGQLAAHFGISALAVQQQSGTARETLLARGIHAETLAALGIRETADGGVEIPIRDGTGKEMAVRIRTHDGQKLWPTQDKDPRRADILTDWQRLKTMKWCLLCEGETDFMAAWQVGFPAATLLHGAATVKESAIQQIASVCKGIATLYDGDDAGREGAAKVQATALTRNLKVKCLDIHKASLTVKDICELYAFLDHNDSKLKTAIDDLLADVPASKVQSPPTTEPEVTAIGGIYRLQWPSEGLTIRVERIHEDSKSVLTAELNIRCDRLIKPVMHEYERINLTSARAKAALGRMCEELAPIGVNWQERINTMASEVIGRHRQGEPIIDLSVWHPNERLRWRVQPLLYDLQANLIYGDGGLGKSVFANYLAVLVAAGLWTDELPSVEPGNVLYLDYETSPDELEDRTQRIARGLALANKPLIYYRFCSQPLWADVEWLQREIMERNISLVIVDSVGPACGGEPDEAAPTMATFRALRPLKVTTLLIAHVAKGAKGKTPFGCYSADTEALTPDGWKFHQDIKAGDTVLAFSLTNNRLLWETVQTTHVYPYAGDMLWFGAGHRNRSTIDLMVTPNHRMVVRPGYQLPRGIRPPTKNPREWHIKEAETLKSNDWIIPQGAPLMEEPLLEQDPLFTQFVGWWISEGCLQDNAPTLTQAEGLLAQRMTRCVAEMGFDYNRWVGQSRPHERPVMQLRLKAAQWLGTWLAQECGNKAANKRIPRLFFSAGPRTRRLLFDALMEGDGTVRPHGWTYSTASKTLADDVQQLAITLGFGASVYCYPPGKPHHQPRYSVNILTSVHSWIKPRNTKRVHYEGDVVCLTVPSGAYIVRRQGRVAIAGNSVYWRNLSRCVWKMVRGDTHSDGNMELGLWHDKVNNGPLLPPRGYSVRFEEDSIAFDALKPQDSDALREELHNAERIALALVDGAKNAKAIAEETSMSEALIRVELSRHKRRFIQLGSGMWGLRV